MDSVSIWHRFCRAMSTEGPWTIYFPKNVKTTIFDASLQYIKDKTALIVLAGKEYGSGSSRDWAAKGVMLLGVRAVIAQSFERIHRSNLVGMGVLPLEFKENQSRESLNLTGDETFDIIGLNDNLKPRQDLKVVVTSSNGTKKEFSVTVRIDTPVEIDYYRNGGILPFVLRKLAK